MFTLVLNNSDELKEIDLYISETFELSTIEIKKYDDKITFIFNNFENSCNSFSLWLSNLIIDLYEKKIIKKIIKKNYFYFEPDEQEKISNISTSIIDENSQSKKDLVFLSVFDYVKHNTQMILEGFIIFRLKDYLEVLDYLVDLSVNSFIINREYNKFIVLLKDYINNEPSKIDILHLVYLNQEAILLDKNKTIIPVNDNILDAKYLSDITFSNNDYILNTILNLVPNKLYVHILNEEDEFLTTLKKIFQKRIKICYNCEICNFYRDTISNNTQ